MEQVTRADAEKLLELADLTLRFGLVERTTHHTDCATRETDTTHTVMLGLVACAFADRFAPHLNRGRVAEFALVHDLVEVYAGDTNTLSASDVDRTDKARREAEALERIVREYEGSYPWIGKTLEEYESLAEPEARFVKVMDKVLPKFVHILNGGHTVRTLGETRASVHAFHERQRCSVPASYGADQPEAFSLLELSYLLSDEMLAALEEAGQ